MNLMSTNFIGLVLLLLSLLCVILASAYLSLTESHVVASMQRSIGPSIVGGSFGMLQPLVDGMKLLLKEYSIPNKSTKFWFVFNPIYTFFITLFIWFHLSLECTGSLFYNNPYTLISMMAFLAMNSYGMLFGSWFSNNKFSLIGALRSVALSISYGLSLTLVFLGSCFLSGSFNISEIMSSQYCYFFITPALPLCVIFWMTILTEMKKIPFDVGESESELGSGYMMEYSSSNFAIFVVCEYMYVMILMSLFLMLFLGSAMDGTFMGFFIFIMKLFFLITIYFVFSSVLPNLRFDQIMVMFWKYLLPWSIFWLLALIYISWL